MSSEEQCRECMSLPPDELRAKAGECRVLSALQASVAPAIFETTVILLTTDSSEPLPKHDIIAPIRDAIGVGESTAHTYFMEAKGTLTDLVGGEWITVEGAGCQPRTHTINPSVIGEYCMTGEPFGEIKQRRPRGAKASQGGRGASSGEVPNDQKLTADITAFILNGSDDPEGMEAELGELKSRLQKEIKRAKINVFGSIQAGQRAVLGEKHAKQYAADLGAMDRFRRVVGLTRQM